MEAASNEAAGLAADRYVTGIGCDVQPQLGGGACLPNRP